MESIYKIDTGSDHVAKFRGDRPRELGDLAAKKKENITGKTEDLPLLRTGGLRTPGGIHILYVALLIKINIFSIFHPKM